MKTKNKRKEARSDGISETAKKNEFRSGFAVIAGKPNTGKSTLLNRLLGEKIAIVSRRPQTTRTKILGVLHGEDFQAAFFDTPGIHTPKGGTINEKMVSLALGTISEVDVILLVADARRAMKFITKDSRSIDPEEISIINRFANIEKPAGLILNKIDIVPKEKLLPIIEAYRDKYEWDFIYPLSALKGDAVSDFPDILAKYLPVSPPLFPEDVLTDQAERILASEYVREQVFNYSHAEIPFGVAVEIRDFDESDRESRGKGLIRIHADIIVERDSHKGIIIGRQGSMLKRIGTAARKELEKLLGVGIWLGLHVRVEKNWTRHPAGLSRFE